jgi:hypothetical protein
MANKSKYKEKKHRYYCVDCERDSIDHKPSNGKTEVYRRCKICKRDTLFLPVDEMDVYT